MMLNRCILLFIFSFGLNFLFAQDPNRGSILTTQNNDVISLVQDIFIKGNCKNVSNIEASGAQLSFGEFENGGNVIGFPEGIILSTGDVKLAEGPNTSVESSGRYGRSSQDKDLREIATNQLFDIAVLEFDFIPLEEEVTFQYVFASEEYCEFVGTIFNDVFGFFVSGPGFTGPFSNGAINVATLPNSNDFVSINSVNHELNQDNYVKNELQDDADNCGVIFNPNHANTIEYDGFTVPLTARFSVIPCETYHIRLVVGDVGDDKLDSAVFLRSESFDLGELATVKALIPNRSDTIAYENCLDGQFVFTRPEGSNRNQPLIVDFEIESTSTTTENLDYPTIPRSITIPTGQNNFVLPIQALEDGEIENLETLTLNLIQTCDCDEGSRATLNLGDASRPEITFSPIAACEGQSFNLQPQIEGGVQPFDYQWNTGSMDSSILVNLQEPTTYSLLLNDFCGNEDFDSITIDFQPIPTATLSGEVDFCTGLADISLPLNFNGFAPWSFTYSIDGNEPITVESIVDASFSLPISAVGNYELIEFSDAACKGIAEGTAIVNDKNIRVELAVISPTCPNGEDGAIEFLDIIGKTPFSIDWTPEIDNVENPTNLKIGDYELTITDAINCFFSTIVSIDPPNPIPSTCENNAIYIPNVFSPNGDGINDVFEIFLSNETTVQKIWRTEILDRWGNLVYFSEEGMPSWDGRFQGDFMDSSVFIYRIQVELNDGKIDLLQGSLSLVK